MRSKFKRETKDTRVHAYSKIGQCGHVLGQVRKVGEGHILGSVRKEGDGKFYDWYKKRETVSFMTGTKRGRR